MKLISFEMIAIVMKTVTGKIDYLLHKPTGECITRLFLFLYLYLYL